MKNNKIYIVIGIRAQLIKIESKYFLCHKIKKHVIFTSNNSIIHKEDNLHSLQHNS